MMVTCHCKTLESSTKPAEKPSIGFRVKSVLFFAFIVVVVVVVVIRRERGKSQYKMLESPRRSPRKKNHHHHHHHRRERETDRQNKTKETMKPRKTTYLSAGFLTEAPLGRSFSFPLSLFALVFLSGLVFITRKTTERSTTNFFGDESLRRLVFTNKSSSSESCRGYSQRYYYYSYYYC